MESFWEILSRLGWNLRWLWGALGALRVFTLRGSDFGTKRHPEGGILGAKAEQKMILGASYLPFPLPSALGEVTRRKCHLFFDLSKPHFFHLIFLLLFCSLLGSSWAPFWTPLGPQVGSILALFGSWIALGYALSSKTSFFRK